MNEGDQQDRSGVFFPPPLLHMLTLFVGLVIHYKSPRSFLPSMLRIPVGLPFIIAAFTVMAWAVHTMRGAGTSVNAYKPTTAMVTGGPYQFSRNPMYLSINMLYIGISIVLKALWPLILLPIALVGITLGVVEREERYLEKKFGEEYRCYKARVPRWL